MISKHRWYMTQDGRAVQEGHPDANSLLVAIGDEIEDEKAKELGVCDGPDDDEAPSFNAPPANKMVVPTPKETTKSKRTK